MTNDKGILIKNVYYMLSYAFQVLKQSNYESIKTENFERIQDLFAAILSKGVAQQVKHGLYREYISHEETIPVVRGKIDMPETIRTRIQRKQRISCEFDELTENNLFNQIIKTTMHYMVKDANVAMVQKVALNKVLVFFSNVSICEPSSCFCRPILSFI